MKLKQDFVLRKVADDNILIPITQIGDKFEGIITLNETSTFIWNLIEQGKDISEIVEEVLNEYNVDEETACKDVQKVCCSLEKLGIL